MWASVGSAFLAAPGLGAAGVLLSLIAGWIPDATASDVLPFAAAVLLVVVVVGPGLVLLRGYWRIRRGEMAARNRRRIWAGSALYNVPVFLASGWVLTVLDQWGLVAVAPPLALLLWAGWMVWIGLRRSVFARSL